MMRVTKDDVRGAYRYYGLFYESEKLISEMFILKTDDGGEDVLRYDFQEEAWNEMGRDEFCRIPDRYPGEFSEMSEQYALWFLEMEQAFNGEGDDEKVKEFLARWSVKKEEYREPFDWGWPAKYVKTKFYLNGKQYCITPKDLGMEGDCWDHGLMEYFQADMGAELKELGASEIRHYGFLD